jgi:hypothetical protein
MGDAIIPIFPPTITITIHPSNTGIVYELITNNVSVDAHPWIQYVFSETPTVTMM